MCALLRIQKKQQEQWFSGCLETGTMVRGLFVVIGGHFYSQLESLKDGVFIVECKAQY